MTNHLRCSGEREMQISTCPAPFNPQAMVPLRTPRTLSTVVCLFVCLLVCLLPPVQTRGKVRFGPVTLSAIFALLRAGYERPIVRFRAPILSSPGFVLRGLRSSPNPSRLWVQTGLRHALRGGNTRRRRETQKQHQDAKRRTRACH